jgi:hypothetical protein
MSAQAEPQHQRHAPKTYQRTPVASFPTDGSITVLTALSAPTVDVAALADGIAYSK